MDLSGKKILMVIAKDTFRDEEYAHPREVFEKYGAEITVASSVINTATGRFGLEVQPDMLVNDVDVEDFDSVVLVGGGGAREYFDNSKVHGIAKTMLSQGKIISAICIAPAIFANAGLLKNKKATVFPSENDLLAEGGAILVDQNVVQDGRIITANGPEAAYEFAEAVSRAISES